MTLVMFCCGFSWGLGKSDPCVEARTTVDTFQPSPIRPNGQNWKKPFSWHVQNGAAGLFVKAQQAEKTSHPDSAMALYRDALAKDTTIAEAHGNLGLLLFKHGRRRSRRRTDQRTHRAARPPLSPCACRYYERWVLCLRWHFFTITKH